MPSQKIKLLFFETYLARINNSLGNRTFKNIYATVNGRKKDILENGRVACAIFVSSLLMIHKLIPEIHATVTGTVIALKKAGWKKISTPRLGCIIVWAEETPPAKNHGHKHIGFYIGQNQAISNSASKGYPVKHHLTFKNKRKIELMLWHNKLE